MTGQIDLKKRLRLLGIDGETKRYMDRFRPSLLKCIDSKVSAFYQHLLSFDEARRVLAPINLDTLYVRQRNHWVQLFSCAFDEKFVRSATYVGDVHYKHRVAPYLYISGYNFFKCSLVRLACANHAEDKDLADIIVAITRLTSFDMDLALSAYARDSWAGKSVKSAVNPKTVVAI